MEVFVRALAKVAENDPTFVVGVEKLDHLKGLGFTSDEIYRVVAPRRTLARRKDQGEPLSLAESDRAMRLERVAIEAERVFASREKALQWLRSEIMALDDRRPIDLLESETGAHVVLDELIRIDYGMFA